MFRLARWLVVLVTALAGVAVVALLVIRTPWFQSWLRGFVVTRLTAAIDGEVSIGGLSGSLLRDVTLRDVVVRQDGEPVLRVARMSARYDPLQLAMGHMVIDEILLEGPKVELRQQPEGWNLAHLPREREEATPATPRAMSIGRLQIIGGSVRVTPMRQPAAVIEALTLEGSLRYTPPAVVVTIDRSTFVERESDVRVTELSGALMLEEGRIAANDIALSATGVRVTGRAATGPPAERHPIDLRVRFDDLRLADLSRYLPPAVPALVIRGDAQLQGATERLTGRWNVQTSAGATHGELTVDTNGPGPAAAGTVSVVNLNLERLLQRSDLTGTITGELKVDAVLGPPARRLADASGSFDLRAGPLRVLQYQATTLRARGRLADGRVAGSGQARAYGALATFEGTLGPFVSGRRPDVVARGRLEHLNVNALPAALQAPALATDINLDYAARARGDEWHATLAFEASEIGGAVIEDGATLAATVAGPVVVAQVQGTVRGVSGELLRLPTTRPTSLAGRVDANVRIPDRAQISLRTLEGAMQLDLRDTTIDGAQVDRAQVSASLGYGQLSIGTLRLNAPGVTISAAGGLAAADGVPVPPGITYRVAIDDLSRLRAFGAPAVTGAASVEGVLQGSLDTIATSGSLSAQQFGFGDTAEALVLDVTYNVEGPTRQPEAFMARAEIESTFLQVRDREIDRVRLSAGYGENRLSLAGTIEERTRAVTLDGDLVLHPDHREVHMRTLTVAGPGAPWQLEGEAQALYGSDQLELRNVRFVREAERIEAGGTIAFSETGESDLVARAMGVQVGDLYTMFTGAARVSGTADAEVRLSGHTGNPSVDAVLSVSNGMVVDVPFSVIGAEVQLRDRRARVDARAVEPAGSTMVVSGTVPVGREGGEIDLRASSSDISLGLLQAFTTEIEQVQGTAGIDVGVTGPLDAPAVNGQLLVTDGSFRVTSTGVAYQQLNADVRFDANTAEIQQFSIADRDGHTLTVAGRGDVISRDGTRTLDVSIQSDAFHVLDGDLGEIEIGARARASGTLAAPVIEGRIEVSRGVLEVDELLARLSSRPAPVDVDTPSRPAEPSAAAALAAPAAVETAAPAPPAPPADERPAEEPDTGLFSRAAVALDIVLPDDVVLRGSDIRTGAGTIGLGDVNLTVGGTVELRKDAGKTPRIVGEIRVVRGFYEFQGRRFEVARDSIIRFRGVQPINPALNVNGEREVSGIVAVVRVTGTMRQPELQLSSRPPLDEGDVLSLIIFNQPVSQLGEGEQVALLERAGDLAASALATRLTESIGNVLDVELFQIRAPTSGQAGEVALGTQLGEGLFVGLRQQFGRSDATHVSLEYQLTETLRLLTAFAQGGGGGPGESQRSGSAGADLVFTIRY
jgi:autotransporter translocation and assembly factor TamB